MKTETLKITGMTCGGCTSAVTRVLVGVDGVHDVQVSLPKGEAVVQYDEQFTSPDKLMLVVQAAGYGVAEKEAAKHEAEGKGGCC